MKRLITTVFIIFKCHYLQAQDKKQLQFDIDSLTRITINPRERIPFFTIDSLFNKYDIYSIINGIRLANRKFKSFSKGNCYELYFDILRLKGRNSTDIREKQLVVNEILESCKDTLKNNYVCQQAIYAVFYSFNREDFDNKAKQTLVNQLYGKRYYDVLRLIGMLDITTEKKRIIELRNNEKDNDILFKLNLVLARWGEEKAMTFFIKKMKENQKENKFYENYSYSIYIANPMVIKFLINEIDSSYEIQLSADDEPVPVGFASADVLEKLIIKFPKALTIEERNLEFYKLWLNKNKNNFKIDRDAVWKYK